MFRLLEPSANWQSFLSCLLFHLGLPLLPIGLEGMFTGKVAATSLTITTAIYAITIGSSSRNQYQFGVGIILGFIFAATFGFVSSGTQLKNINTELISYIAMSVIASIHIIERISRHIYDGETFFQFKTR